MLGERDGRVVAVDTMVEGVHFRRDWSSWADVGWKLLASNVSDIRACGAEPRAWLLSLGLTAVDVQLAVPGLLEGIEQAMATLGTCPVLVGGDTVQCPAHSVLSVTMIGAGGDRFLARSGARPGHGIWLSGELGWAAAGLSLLRRGQTRGTDGAAARALAAHRRPVPDRFATPTGAGAMIDVSDGLASDLRHLAGASRVRLVVDLPLPGAEALGSLVGGDQAVVQGWQMDGGDDYRAVWCGDLPPAPGWARIGEVEAGDPGLILRKPDGTRHPVERGGYRHFGSPSSTPSCG